MTTTGYDEQHDDPDNLRWYCRHGNYIGTPGGPDHMCGYCEMGDEPMSPREQFENDRTRFHERLAGLERVLADLIDKHLITPGVGWRCLDDMLNCGSLWYVNAAYWCESNNTWPDPPERNKT